MQKISKLYDVHTSDTITTSEVSAEYGLFVKVDDYKEYGEDAPIYMKLPRERYVKVGHCVPRNDVCKCYRVIAR